MATIDDFVWYATNGLLSPGDLEQMDHEGALRKSDLTWSEFWCIVDAVFAGSPFSETDAQALARVGAWAEVPDLIDDIDQAVKDAEAEKKDRAYQTRPDRLGDDHV